MFESQYQEFIYTRTYARYVDEHQRREQWEETVDRYAEFFLPRVPESHHWQFKQAIHEIKLLGIMPSMRALWTAGPALERDNIAGFNCAYAVLNQLRVFAEILHILMNGAGVGYSVEQRYVDQLPPVPDEFAESDRVLVFVDSKRGWAEGFYRYIRALFQGEIPKYDLSKIRPKGAPLKTFGGRASGPGPLEDLLKFTRSVVVGAAGRKLTPLECHDICCQVAESVVVGGVRRSACISLTDLHGEMATAKMGSFPTIRWNANISVAYDRKPSVLEFMEEWRNLILSKAGERGIFNRQAATFAAAATGRRDVNHDFGCNPCGEIILRPMQFCNLTEVVVRVDDDREDLLKKVQLATVLGCLQATLTKYGFISKQWTKNSSEERLLGVSLTGLMDHPVLNKVSKEAKRLLYDMREEARKTAREWSELLGIPMPTAITTNKPSGTVSQLVNSSSGIHTRHAPYYIRRVESASTDPLAQMLIDQGVPFKKKESGDGYKFEFPIKSPNGAKTDDDMSALQQLEYWRMLKDYWCEHNPSCTVKVKKDEWLEVGAWVYRNFNAICGVTFYPKDEDTVYIDPPYEEIDEETYSRLVADFPAIDFSRLPEYEQRDQTTGARELACSGGACEL